MCYFITIAVPPGACSEVIARYNAPDFNVSITRNASALVAAGAGWSPLNLTAGGCSCGWYKPHSYWIELIISPARSQ